MKNKIRSVLALILRKCERFLTCQYYRFRHWIGGKLRFEIFNVVADITNTLAWLVLVLYQVIKGGSGSHVVYGAAIVMALTRVVPPLRKVLSGKGDIAEYKLKRRIRTASCLEDINKMIANPSELSSENLMHVRKKLLECIVEHVREYRGDLYGTKIYSNLLIREGEEIVVVARDSPSRKEGVRYSKDALLSSKVFDEIKAISCGRARDHTERHIEYESFMALPVVDYNNNTCLAVITIDSTEPHHFDDIYQSLETMLRPYTRTLAITFTLEQTGAH
ncbi:GAF domain-containing protein [Methylocaldum sp. 14B]|jgi:hypothetical protein|uniref:GAF domain-containing protein n=1 Tax=Methylocaldum sp. 14B TaxID=1912213 RepID=UPI00117D2D43|nr:GAF domain-containing protein [Methylocaldum sp. 14B]